MNASRDFVIRNATGASLLLENPIRFEIAIDNVRAAVPSLQRGVLYRLCLHFSQESLGTFVRTQATKLRCLANRYRY